MTTNLLVLDPSGDIELVLSQPNAQELQWPADDVLRHVPADPSPELIVTKKDKKKKKGKQSKTTARQGFYDVPLPADDQAELVSHAEPIDPEFEIFDDAAAQSENLVEPESALESSSTCSENDDVGELRMLVSSRHLRLASKTFRNILEGPWHDRCGNNEPVRTIRMSDWDSEAFIIVLDVIHGQSMSVPREVSLELLARISAIVDYLDCHEIIEVLVERWIQPLEKTLPSSYGKECMLWMSMSWVFLRVDILQKMAETAVLGCHQPVQSMSLPLPDFLWRTIEDKRKEAVDKICQALDDLCESLCEEIGCSSGCSSMMLGSLMRQMRGAGISKARDHSVGWLYTVVSKFASPTLCSRREFYDFGDFNGSDQNSCSLKHKLKPCLEESLNVAKDLRLDQIWSKRVEKREARRQLSLTSRKWRVELKDG